MPLIRALRQNPRTHKNQYCLKSEYFQKIRIFFRVWIQGLSLRLCTLSIRFLSSENQLPNAP